MSNKKTKIVMRFRGIEIKLSQLICLALYYGFARYLPVSFAFLLGRPSKWVRYQLCKRIFKECGKDVNIERMAMFGSGRELEIGDNSGIGQYCNVPSNIKIGRDVMMGPNCYILRQNHSFDRVDIPMRMQGFQSESNVKTVIEDDVWIGRGVLMTPGRHISKGTIVGGGQCYAKIFLRIV